MIESLGSDGVVHNLMRIEGKIMNKCWIFSLLLLVILPGCIRRAPKIEDSVICNSCQSAQCVCDVAKVSTGSIGLVAHYNDLLTGEVDKFDKRVTQLTTPSDLASKKVNGSTQELTTQAEVRGLDNNTFHDFQFGFGNDAQLMDDEQGRDSLKQNITLAQKLLKESKKNDEDITFLIKVDLDNGELDAELSKKRANVVADHLIASGIPRDKIQIADASDDANFVSNSDKVGSDEDGLNRRNKIEVVCS